jgi:hypothetical protein
MAESAVVLNKPPIGTIMKTSPAPKESEKTASDAFVMPKKYDFNARNKCFSACILGPPGIGKTRMAIASLPERAKVVILATEHGFNSVKDELNARKHTYWPYEITHSHQLIKMLEYIESKPPGSIDYVVLDSVNELAEMIGKELEHLKKTDGYKYWDKYSIDFRLIIKRFLALPIITICTCIPIQDSHPKSQTPVWCPLMKGKDAKFAFLSWFDEVFFLKNFTDDDGKSSGVYAVTSSFDDLPGKDRSGQLEEIELPDMELITKKIFRIPIEDTEAK